MVQHLDSIWRRTMEKLVESSGPQAITSWLTRMRPIALRGEVLYLRAPHQLAAQWASSHRFKSLLLAALRDVVGASWDLRFLSPGDELPAEGTIDTAAPPRSSTPLAASSVRQQQVSPGVLNSRYTFDAFVVGGSNRFAHAASLAVAEEPAGAYNPLFLYGGVGLGKTHLMQAIGHHVLERCPDTKVVYVSTETFTNDLIESIGRKSMKEFRNKYRHVDVLLLDDVQFLAGKNSTQEELFHTFNALYEAKKQVVLSSDRPPKEIPTLEERLRSRFEWGLIADIQPPDLETRVAILRKKAEEEGLYLDDEVTHFIADKVRSNIRELEGALVKVIAYSNMTGKQIDLALARDALKHMLSLTSRRIGVESIQRAVSAHYGISTNDMKSRKRTRAIAFPRQVAMYLARELTELSLPKIGEAFGNRDHSTVLHACEKIAREMKDDPSFAAELNQLKEQISHG